MTTLIAYRISLIIVAALAPTSRSARQVDLHVDVDNGNSIRSRSKPKCAMKGNRICPKKCRCVRILHFNDVYKFRPSKASNVGTWGNVSELRLPAEGKLGGFDVLKSVLQLERENAKRDGFTPVVTFGGDHLGPSFLSQFETGGLHMIEALNELQVDMVNWGNHEFDLGVELALWNMLCSRFPWLAANMRETVKGMSAKPLLGSRYVRKKSDWRGTDDGSILGQLGDFTYQPANGVLVVPLSKYTKVCFAGLTTDESANGKYGKPVQKMLPKNTKLRRFVANRSWAPTHAPEGKCRLNTCSVEELFKSCPVNGLRHRPGQSEDTTFEGIQDTNGSYTFYRHWKDELPNILKAAKKSECTALAFVSHLKHADDKELLAKDDLIKLVLGGHDHEPHMYMMQREGAPIEQATGLAVKVGLDGQYVARLDLVFSEHDLSRKKPRGKFDHIHFDLRDSAAGSAPCTKGDCRPADILVVQESKKYPSDVRMRHLMLSFEGLAYEYSSVHVASGFMGTFNTLAVRSRETAASNFYMDTLLSWASDEQNKCTGKTKGSRSKKSSCRLHANVTRAIRNSNASKLPVIAFLNSGTFRSNEYAEDRYPEGRPFSMLEVRSDIPFPDTTSVWMMSAQDFLVLLAALATNHGDGMFPSVGGLEFTMEPAPQPQRLRYGPSVSLGIDKTVAQVRLQKEEESGRSSRAFADCIFKKLGELKTIRGACRWNGTCTASQKLFTSRKWLSSCQHYGNWMQDELKRGSELLLVGPFFIMEKAEKIIDHAYTALESLSRQLETVGIDSASFITLIRSQRKTSHMKNQLRAKVVLYDAVKEQLLKKYGPSSPIDAGSDCVNPDPKQLAKMYSNFRFSLAGFDTSFEWAAAAATQYIKDPSREICFRTRQAEASDQERTYVTDDDQSLTSKDMQKQLSFVEERINAGSIRRKAQHRKTTNLIAQHIMARQLAKLLQNNTDAVAKSDMDMALKAVNGDGWDPLMEAWNKYVRKLKGEGTFLVGLTAGDMLRITGPYQWLGDDPLSFAGLFKTREIADFVKQLWQNRFNGPAQTIDFHRFENLGSVAWTS